MRVGQTRIGSVIESLMNVAVGYLVALLTQTIVFPLYGFYASLEQHIGIGIIFTGVSLARSYALRRLFNWLTYLKPPHRKKGE